MTTKVTDPTEGLLLAPVGPEGPWHALRALREGIREFAGDRAVSTTFISAFTEEGRTADAHDAAASLLAVGVRVDA